MSPFKLPKMNPMLQFADSALTPIMFILGGFKSDSVQQTHAWHSFRDFDLKDVDLDQAVPHAGTDNRSFKRHFLFLFHAPIFGGWKNYIVLAPKQPIDTFFIGWIIYDKSTNKLLEKGIHKLPIKNRIRMLSGPPNYKGYFFAVDKNGNQIEIKQAGSGILGDHKYPGTRLF